ncbi:MAG TPA: sulfatase [Planctomycetota bacterium]|nr:sulfatase [Planctomycetota bacterium]
MTQKGVSRREFLAKAAVGSAALMLSRVPWVYADDGKAERPNILFITGDDHDRYDLVCCGNPFLHTPAFDSLAADGTRFDRAFTVTAVCTPSRACFHTGLYPHANGSYGFVPMKRGVRIISEYLHDVGYQTGCIGKLHLMPDKSKAFDTYVADKDLEEGRDIDGFARETRKFLAAGTKDKPFYLELGFCDPHRPFPTPGVKEGRAKEMPNPHDPVKVQVPPYLADIPEVRSELAQYYDAIHRLDRGIALILDALENSGRAENTLVMYAGDHGRAFPFSKTTLYDMGLNVPFLARWPGKLPAGATTGAMIHFVDILPTFLELAGVDIPEHIQGKSFAAVLRGETQKHRDVAFGSHTAHFYSTSVPSRSIHEERFHYIYNLTSNEFCSNSLSGIAYTAMVKAAENDPALAARLHRLKYRPREELYDVKADRFEMTNLADDAKFADELKRMNARLAAFMKEIDDPWLPVLLEQCEAAG